MISKNNKGVYYPGKYDEQKSELRSSQIIHEIQSQKGPIMAVPGRHRSKVTEDQVYSMVKGNNGEGYHKFTTPSEYIKS